MKAVICRIPFVLLSMIISIPPTLASTTQDMKIEGSAGFLEGKFSGAGLNDLGELVAGLQATKTSPVEEAAYLLSSTALGHKTYFGAGYPASIVVYDGKTAARLPARFGGDFAISATATDGRNLFAAGLPSAAIYKIDDRGNTMPFADFSSTGSADPNYIWAIAAHRGYLYAALGGHFPSVYKIDLKTSKKELLYQVEGKAKNVTALLVTDEAILFGDDAGRVYRLAHGSTSRPAVLYSFSDAEIKSIAVYEGGLAVAVNSRRFVPPPPPPPSQSKDQPKSGEEQPEEGSGDYSAGSDLKKAMEEIAPAVEEKLRAAENPETPVSGKPAPPPPPGPSKAESPAAQAPPILPAYQDPFGKGEGNLFWMSADGQRVHRLWYSPSSIILSMMPGEEGVWIATSNPGRLYRITLTGSERLFYESASKDLSVISSAGKVMLAAASNPPQILEIEPAGGGEYSSKVFDAGFPARIGKPEVTGAGSENSELLIRSGSTSEVDSGWTDYKNLQSQMPQGVGRFFQVKLKIKTAAAAIRRIRLPYRVQNLYPRLTSLTSEVVRAQDGSTDGKDIRFQWEVTNLDNDVLEYQLSYRPPGGKKFISVYDPTDKPRNVKTLSVPAEQFPDGTYRFRLEVSDEPANGAEEALTNAGEFPLVLLDQTPPAVELRQEGDHARWAATDAASRVARAEYRLDGGPWKSLQADDGLFDSASETGRVAIPAAAGGGVMDVRCFDERENSRIYSLILK